MAEVKADLSPQGLGAQSASAGGAEGRASYAPLENW